MEPCEQWVPTQPCPVQRQVEPCEQLPRMHTCEERQPVMINPNPPLLVPIIPTHVTYQQNRKEQPCDSNRQETIATTWIPIQQPKQRPFHPVQDTQKTQNLQDTQYSHPRTKSVTVQNCSW